VEWLSHDVLGVRRIGGIRQLNAGCSIGGRSVDGEVGVARLRLALLVTTNSARDGMDDETVDPRRDSRGSCDEMSQAPVASPASRSAAPRSTVDTA
jgi:hypothetical protein